MLPLIGAGIGAAASLAGGFLNRSAAQDMNAQNIANQMLFAKNAIQWKVQDAQKAGIHPLFALGASTQGFNNVVGDTSLGSAISDAGQNIGRAVSATGDQESKALLLKSAQLEVEGKGLDNDIKRAELAAKNRLVGQPGSPPAMPGVTLGGNTLQPSPLYSDAQKMEDRWGEMADVFGPVILDADLRRTLGISLPEAGAKVANTWADKHYTPWLKGATDALTKRIHAELGKVSVTVSPETIKFINAFPAETKKRFLQLLKDLEGR